MNSRMIATVVLALTVGAVGSAMSADGAKGLEPLLPRPLAKSAFPSPALVPPVEGEFELPLELANPGGPGGSRAVTAGVPLLPGQAKEVGRLRVIEKGEGGKVRVIPSQARVLARWWRADNSIRWVLLDFVVSLPANGSTTVYLTNRTVPALPPAPAMAVEQTPDRITIRTGAAEFVVSRKAFNLFQSVKVGGVELLDANSEQGLVIEDTLGTKYYSTAESWSVEVIERGSNRVRVRARGQFRPAGKQGGYSRGMYDYDVFMDFFAGSPEVKLDAILCNNAPESRGAPTFEDASLWLKLAGPVADCTLAGDKGKPIESRPPEGGSICLYQDSSGADSWNRCQGYNTEQRDYWRYPEGKTAGFRGYKVWKRSGDKEDEIAAGNQATGTTVARNDRGGVVVHLIDFWQQFPKGVEVFADGRVRLALFPREYKVVHFLEDATAKGHEIVLRFFSKGPPEAAELARRSDAKVLARPPLTHIAACGALADFGPFTVPTEGLTDKPNNRTEAYGSRMLTTDGLYGNAYGWQILGERWRSCGGHSSRGARQPMNEDNYLYRWFVTGVHGWLLNGYNRSRQFRDVRAYRIEGVDPFGYKGWDDFRAHNRSEDWTRRPQPKDAEAEKYSAGRYPRSTFWLPNPAHMVLDLPYDRYLLTGDQRSLENMRIIAAHGGYYAGYRPPVVHRATGWSWRTLYRYWELTGDKDAERQMAACIANFKQMAEKEEVPLPMARDTVNWWFTFVFSRAAAMAALQTGDPDALFICKRMAETLAANRAKHKGYAYRDYSELNAVLWHLTGKEEYKKEGLGPDGGERLKVVDGRMKLPACAHWLLTHPPRK